MAQDIKEERMVSVAHKKFVGIGKMIFRSSEEWNIPHLHFMVDKTNSGNFEATLLEFGLVSWAETKDEVIQSLFRQVAFYIFNTKEQSKFDQMLEDVDNHAMDDYWRCYRKIDFSLAKSGRGLNRKIESRLIQKVIEMVREEILSEETQKATHKSALDRRDRVEKFVKMIDKTFSQDTSYDDVVEDAA